MRWLNDIVKQLFIKIEINSRCSTVFHEIRQPKPCFDTRHPTADSRKSFDDESRSSAPTSSSATS